MNTSVSQEENIVSQESSSTDQEMEAHQVSSHLQVKHN